MSNNGPVTQLLSARLINQRLVKSDFRTPEEVVAWMGAMQAQEYAMAKWAIGLRLPGSSDSAIEQSFNKGRILRTHLLRPTWHFVTPQDIRWVVALTAPRIHAASAFMYRQCELDKKIFNRSAAVIARALEGSNFLTRRELQAILKKSRITASGFRLGYLMMHAELECIICSGPRIGNQFTYGLMDERAPTTGERFDRSKALERLTRIYFGSRGPATIHDYATWSGLTVREVRLGVEMIQPKASREQIGGKEYWSLSSTPLEVTSRPQTSFLMPDYDEYGMGYKDRTALSPAVPIHKRGETYNRMIIVDGTIKGSWKRSVEKGGVRIETVPFVPWNRSDTQKVKRAVKNFGKFLDRTVL